MNSPEKTPPKRSYHAPVLEVYGQIRELTKVTGGTMGANDQVQMSNKTG